MFKNTLANVSKSAQAALDVAGVKGKGLINNMRGVEGTVDEKFEFERKRFDATVLSVTKMETSLRTHSNGLNTFVGDGMKNFAANVALFSGEDKRAVLSDQFVQTVDQLIVKVEPYQAQLLVFQGNLKQLGELLAVTTREINERDRLLLSFDSARHDLANEQKKPTPNPQQLGLLQQTFEKTKIGYEQRNEQVLFQLVGLNNNRTIHDDYVKLVTELAGLFRQFSDIFAPFAAQVAKTPAPPVVAQPAAPMHAAPTHAPMQAAAPPPLPNRAAPPPVPSSVRQARAMYPFKSESPDELPLNPGDIVVLNNTSHPDWWTGSCNGRSGQFPAAYVTPM